jgi:fatty-acid desaturase
MFLWKSVGQRYCASPAPSLRRHPHSPIKGKWHAFMGWSLSYQLPPPSAKIGADLVRDYPFLKFYTKIEWLVQPVFFIIVYLISYQLMLICMLAAVLSYTTGMLLNAFSHNPKIADSNKAVDSKLLAILVNPIYLHRRHHADGSAADYSFEQVYDISWPIIKYLLTKK